MSKWPCRVGGCVECKTLTGHDLLILDVTLGTLLTASLPFLLFMNILFFSFMLFVQWLKERCHCWGLMTMQRYDVLLCLLGDIRSCVLLRAAF